MSESEPEHLTAIQTQALWWAKFITTYGIGPVLAGFLLAVMLGFLNAPMFSGEKQVEIDARDALVRLETNQSVLLLQLEMLDRQFSGMHEGIDRVSCLLLLTPEQRAKIRSRADFDLYCAWAKTSTDREWPR